MEQSYVELWTQYDNATAKAVRQSVLQVILEKAKAESDARQLFKISEVDNGDTGEEALGELLRLSEQYESVKDWVSAAMPDEFKRKKGKSKK